MSTAETTLSFTKTALVAIEPANKRIWYRDTKTQGLALCVTPAGSKTFYVIRRVAGMGRKGNTEFIRLGVFQTDLTVEQARVAARQKLKTLNAGESVRSAATAKKEEMTVADLWSIWKTERAVGPNPAKPIKRSWKKDQRLYECHLKDRGKRRVSEVTAALASKIFRDVTVASGPVEANHVKRLARAMWNHVIKHNGLDVRNPWSTIKDNHEAKRDMWVEPAQMPALLRAIDAVDNPDVAEMLKIALFTGARSGNVKAMRWDKINLERAVWTIPSSHHKNKLTHTIPLPPDAVAILRQRIGVSREWVFPAATKEGHMGDIRKTWLAILKVFATELDLSEVPDLHIHDLRHTVASWLVSSNVSLPIVGKLLGHTQAATTNRYAHLATDPVRKVLDLTVAAMGQAEAEGANPASGLVDG